MIKSKLPNNVLGKVWKLSDVDKDGMLDADEFALAMHLINIKMDGHDLPTELPVHLIPPTKRGFWDNIKLQKKIDTQKSDFNFLKNGDPNDT